MPLEPEEPLAPNSGSDLPSRIVPALVATLISAALVFGALAWLSRSGARDAGAAQNSQLPTKTEPLPNLSLPDLRTGQDRPLRGAGRPTVVNFLAFSCVPCVKELPMIADVADSYPGADFIGIHVNAGKDRAKAEAFVRRLNPSFPIVYDPDRRLDSAVFALPTTIFLDAQGDEIGRVTGAITRSDLVNRLERLLQ
jgi:thiol-disulfide isomerase/thioredoxin